MDACMQLHKLSGVKGHCARFKTFYSLSKDHNLSRNYLNIHRYIFDIKENVPVYIHKIDLFWLNLKIQVNKTQ